MDLGEESYFLRVAREVKSDIAGKVLECSLFLLWFRPSEFLALNLLCALGNHTEVAGMHHVLA